MATPMQCAPVEHAEEMEKDMHIYLSISIYLSN